MFNNDEDNKRYNIGARRFDNFIPQMPSAPPVRTGYKAIKFRLPRISDRLRWWFGIGKYRGYAPNAIACTTVYKDILFIVAGATIFRLDKVKNEMVIVPFHETVCNKCKGEPV